MPYVNHYTCLIVGAVLKNKFIKNGTKFFTDDQKCNNKLIPINDYKSHLMDICISYILIYNKII